MKIPLCLLVPLLVADVAAGFGLVAIIPKANHNFPQHQQQRSRCRQSLPFANTLSMAEKEQDTSTDVSVPTESVARLAYDEWRVQFNKGPFDAQRFANFKQNYETITVANVMAKKKARDEGTVSVLYLLNLNEWADCSAAEYAAAAVAAARNPNPITAATAAATAAPLVVDDAMVTSEDTSRSMTEPETSSSSLSLSSVPPPTTVTVVSTNTVLNQALETAEKLSEASSALSMAADALAEEEEVRQQ
jgi:hypothetical protein